jgi:hypothetical protein
MSTPFQVAVMPPKSSSIPKRRHEPRTLYRDRRLRAADKPMLTHWASPGGGPARASDRPSSSARSTMKARAAPRRVIHGLCSAARRRLTIAPHHSCRPTAINPLGVKGAGRAGCIAKPQRISDAILDALTCILFAATEPCRCKVSPRTRHCGYFSASDQTPSQSALGAAAWN